MLFGFHSLNYDLLAWAGEIAELVLERLDLAIVIAWTIKNPLVVSSDAALESLDYSFQGFVRSFHEMYE
jgi:hypothetical protein